MDTPEQLEQVLMARQPIFDLNQQVVAYELLYRTDSITDRAVLMPICGTTASSQVLLNVYTSITEDGETRQLPAFINLTEQMLLSASIPQLPDNELVVEILEDVPATPDVIAAVKELRNRGFRIALDDFDWDDSYIPLLELADIVKIDVLSTPIEQLPALVERLKPWNLTLLAEKIETHAILEQCKALGFELFQGFFLSKPKLVKGRKLEGNQVAMMQVLHELQQPNVTTERLETLIAMDPVLTYRLLRIVNSAGVGLARKVQNLSEAIVLLGLVEIRKWASLIAMTASKDKPQELTRQLLIRSRMCEKTAEGMSLPNSSAYFMAGMMSGMHALLDVDKKTLMQQVALDDEITEAVSTGAGTMGKLLRCVIYYQNGNFERLPPKLNLQLFDATYREALEWTNNALEEMYKHQ